MKRLLTITVVASGVLLLATIGGAIVLDRFFTTEVQFITPKASEVVQMERLLWQPGDPVADIHGIATDSRTRVVLVDHSKLIRPAEDPGLLLLKVDKQAGDNPLQIKTVWFVTHRVLLGLGIVFVASLLLLLKVSHSHRRRKPGAVDAPGIQTG